MDIGLDIVAIARIKQILNDAKIVQKFFHFEEITDDPQSLAGILAVKEAYMKACGQKLDWLSIEVRKNEFGKPYLVDKPNTRTSITHDGEYALAVVLIM